MTKEEFQIELSQLMKHKTIYAIEMVATILFISTFVDFFDKHLEHPVAKSLDWLVFIGGGLFLAYIIFKSSMALKRVNELEKKL